VMTAAWRGSFAISVGDSSGTSRSCSCSARLTEPDTGAITRFEDVRDSVITRIVFVPSICKSAGTLVCLAANKLIMSPDGELGPLDVQMKKKDEFLIRSSGLDLLSSLQELERITRDSFRGYFLDIQLGTGISTKMAAEIATELAAKTMEPVFRQIDPYRIGEASRAMEVAMTYGEMLKSGNVLEEAIVRLAYGYPSHSFVIDLPEAKKLFGQVDLPSKEDEAFAHVCMEHIQAMKERSAKISQYYQETGNEN